ncbi:hypothetical protein F3Y22_tig00000889pilonHSYRG00016 [Hibiscus syriacus]|uniref:Uncharacterized protein n=1 Tax=Hibiscus syriacus TaxID=106335 RepID=A0A6A3D445_HIBSY|nr:hypothetical protein F3Y22_tig00000889pilonHSYRG00016 [Hibiscus syriacus]
MIGTMIQNSFIVMLVKRREIVAVGIIRVQLAIILFIPNALSEVILFLKMKPLLTEIITTTVTYISSTYARLLTAILIVRDAVSLAKMKLSSVPNVTISFTSIALDTVSQVVTKEFSATSYLSSPHIYT